MSDDLVARLRAHADAWGVTADTPDEGVMNETAMARKCARAANEIDSLRKRVAEIRDMLEFNRTHSNFWNTVQIRMTLKEFKRVLYGVIT